MPMRYALLILLFITSKANSQSAGRIVFSEHPSSAPLTSYVLTNTSDLFMSVSMPYPNGRYLQKLVPNLGIDSLLKIGNYQFSFFVDNKLVYQTNLLPGAPRAAQQTADTVWSKPLIDNAHEGSWWSQSAYNRFLQNGGDSALTEGPHQFRLELRAYVKTDQVKVSGIIAAGELPMRVNRVPVINLSAVELSRILPYDGLPVSQTPFDTSIVKELKAMTAASVFKHITSIVVIRNGQLQVEEYFNGAGRDSLHDVRSVGKSFASTLAGLAIADGYLSSEKETLGELYDLAQYKNASSSKNHTSISDLLTMSSDFDGDDDDYHSPGNEENMYPAPDWVRFTLDLPMDTVRYRGQWHYFTAGAMLVGSTLDKMIPGGLERYANKRLFEPLHIKNYQWQYTPQKVVNTAGGIRMNALDFAKYGQLYKNEGSWKGKQILSKEWVRKSLSRQKKIPGRTNEYYGYLFWNKTYEVNGRAYETYYCAGNGGNKIFIFKDTPLVVVITATAYGTVYAHPQVDRMIQQYILPAMIGASRRQ